jgi:serine/threonine protein kinase
VPGLDVHVVLDRDSTLTAGLALNEAGQRVLVLVGAPATAPGARRDFLDWAQALAHVGRVAPTAVVVDHGHTDDGRPFLATYAVPSLADRMRRVGRPTHRTVATIATTVADVLAAAHASGIVHGAVSPATVLLDDEAARLGGFGALAPGLETPLGVWAFTAPEHRAAAATGGIVGTPAADVFGLAATICVARAGMLPWSDPVSWADAAGLPGDGEVWADAIRAALDPDPDRRPTAEEFAAAMREAPETTGDETAARADLRGLIPRAVRRLAAYSIDAMADAGPLVVARVAPPHAPTDGSPRRRMLTRLAGRVTSNEHAAAAPGDVAPLNRSAFGDTFPGDPALTDPVPSDPASSRSAPSYAPSDDSELSIGRALRARPSVGVVAAIATALLLGTGAYAWAQHGPPPASPTASASTTTGSFGAPQTAPTTPARPPTVQLLAGARQAAQSFIHNVGVRNSLACAGAEPGDIVMVSTRSSAISCSSLVQHAESLLGSKTLNAMSAARVEAVTPVSSGANTFGNSANPEAIVSLTDVPHLTPTLRRLEMVLTYRSAQWWIVEVSLG